MQMPYLNTMPKAITQEALTEELRKMVGASTMTAVAKEAGVSIVYISEILSGRRPLGPKVAEFLGYERKVIYLKIAA